MGVGVGVIRFSSCPIRGFDNVKLLSGHHTPRVYGVDGVECQWGVRTIHGHEASMFFKG